MHSPDAGAGCNESADSVCDIGAVVRMFWAALGRGPSYTPVAVQPNGLVMAKLADLLEAGKLRINIDKVFPLKQARWAFVQSLPCQGQCSLLFAFICCMLTPSQHVFHAVMHVY